MCSEKETLAGMRRNWRDAPIPDLSVFASNERVQTNPSDLGAMQAAFAAFETAIDGMRQDSVPREVQDDALERLFGFAVALEQIGCNLGFAHAPLSGSPLCRADGAFMAS